MSAVEVYVLFWIVVFGLLALFFGWLTLGPPRLTVTDANIGVILTLACSGCSALLAVLYWLGTT